MIKKISFGRLANKHLTLLTLVTLMAAFVALLNLTGGTSSAARQTNPPTLAPAQCYFETTGRGVRLDGDCKTTYSGGNGQVGSVTLVPPGGDFLDDFGSCLIVHLNDRSYEGVDCDNLNERALVWQYPGSTSAGQMLSIDWSTRIEYLSPVRIRDNETGIVYGTARDIFGNGSTPYINDCDDRDCHTLFAPMDDAGKPVYSSNGKCNGVFFVQIDEGGGDMALHAAQPSMVGSSCALVNLPVDNSRTYRDGDFDQANKVIDCVGSAGGSKFGDDECQWGMDFESVKLHSAVAALVWVQEGKLTALDKASGFPGFTVLSEDISLQNAKASWVDDGGDNSPDEATRSADGWGFYSTGATDGDCKNVTVVISPDKTEAYAFVQKDDGSLDPKNFDEKPIDLCIWGRNVEGFNGGPFHHSGGNRPAWIGYVERATFTAEQAAAATGDFEGTDGLSEPEAAGTATEPDDTCSSEGGALGWILCPLLTVLDETTQELESQIQGFLFVKTDRFETDREQKTGVYKAWSTFRGLATVIIVIIALIMIFSQSMGDGIFDNYSVKKILPRLVIAGIGIQLSWFLITELVNIFNILGNGIGGLILSNFTVDGVTLSPDTNLTDVLGGITRTASAGDALTGTLFVGLVIAAPFMMGGLVAAAIGVAAAVVVGIVTLIVRDMIILLGIVFAPIAIAMSVLPGTQKTSKWWWESLEKALMMYPLIMALLAVGKVVGSLLLESATPDGDAGIKMTYVIAGIIAWYLPFFFLPKVLQMGGSALNKISGFAGDKSKGMFEKAKGWNEGRRKKMGDIKTNQALAKGGFRAGMANFKAGNFGGIKSDTRATTRMARDSQIGDAKQKAAQTSAYQQYAEKRKSEIEQLKAAGTYDKEIHGTGNLVLDQAQAKVRQVQGVAKNFDFRAAMAEMDVQEAATAVKRASLEFQSNADAGELAGIANDATLLPARRQAAAERVLQLKKTAELGTIDPSIIQQMADTGKYSDIKEVAPHLLPGANVDDPASPFNGKPKVFTDPGSAPSPEAISKWTKETMELALTDAKASGNTTLIENIRKAHNIESVSKTMGSDVIGIIKGSGIGGLNP